jgi:hypothetical protein
MQMPRELERIPNAANRWKTLAARGVPKLENAQNREMGPLN